MPKRHHLTRGVCGLRHPAPRQILRNLQGAEHKWARVHDVSVRADSTVNRVFERIEIAARCVARWGNSEDWTCCRTESGGQISTRKHSTGWNYSRAAIQLKRQYFTLV